jgi:hypothetical protein
MDSVAFVRRINPDGSRTSSCAKCQSTVAATFSVAVIEAAENHHTCTLSRLSDSGLTLTERVLMFFKKHCV